MYFLIRHGASLTHLELAGVANRPVDDTALTRSGCCLCIGAVELSQWPSGLSRSAFLHSATSIRVSEHASFSRNVAPQRCLEMVLALPPPAHCFDDFPRPRCARHRPGLAGFELKSLQCAQFHESRWSLSSGPHLFGHGKHA